MGGLLLHQRRAGVPGLAADPAEGGILADRAGTFAGRGARPAVRLWHGKQEIEKGVPLRGRCSSSQTGADEVFQDAFKRDLHCHLISRCATASPQGEAFDDPAGMERFSRLRPKSRLRRLASDTPACGQPSRTALRAARALTILLPPNKKPRPTGRGFVWICFPVLIEFRGRGCTACSEGTVYFEVFLMIKDFVDEV